MRPHRAVLSHHQQGEEGTYPGVSLPSFDRVGKSEQCDMDVQHAIYHALRRCLVSDLSTEGATSLELV